MNVPNFKSIWEKGKNIKNKSRPGKYKAMGPKFGIMHGNFPVYCAEVGLRKMHKLFEKSFFLDKNAKSPLFAATNKKEKN